jgi:hypothetical protein
MNISYNKESFLLLSVKLTSNVKQDIYLRQDKINNMKILGALGVTPEKPAEK